MNKNFNCSVCFNVYLTNKEFVPYVEEYDEYSEYPLEVHVDDIVCKRLEKLQYDRVIDCFDWDFTPTQDIEHTNIYHVLTNNIEFSEDNYYTVVENFKNILSAFHNEKVDPYGTMERNTLVISDINLIVGDSELMLNLTNVFSPLGQFKVINSARRLVNEIFNVLGIEF